MRLFSSTLLLGAVSGLCEAGVLPIRQAPAPPCSPVTMYVTVIQTVTNTPATVTILQQDPNAVASSMASIDTAQVSIESEENPVSAQPIGTQTFIHSVKVSGYEATEISNTPGASVYYVSAGPSTTNWSYKPSASIVAGVTTVTVVPVPAATSHRQDVQANTTTNSNGHTAFTSPYGGWNGSTSAGSSLFGPATAGTGSSSPVIASPYGPPAPLTSSTVIQPEQTQWTSTVTEVATVYATVTPGGGYGYDTSDYGYGSVGPDYGYGSVGPIGSDLEKRQTCVWISATIGGQEVGWCNNWAGGSTLTFTSWETTTTPTYIPGIGPITKASSSSESSDEGSVTIQTSTDLSSTSLAAPTATACGDVGPFQIGFDDLPEFSTTDNNTADFPPIFNPYDHFFWGDGWAYVPPPNEPFPPQSGDHLAQFIPSLNNTISGSTDAGTIPPSSFGAGPRNYDNNYWFAASSAYVGCDNGSRNLSQICDFVATAYQWDNYTQSEVVVATQHFRIPPCPDFKQCQLTQISFNYLFYKMSTLSFYANVLGQVSQFWIDSIDMNWYNNTCAAGLTRIQSR